MSPDLVRTRVAAAAHPDATVEVLGSLAADPSGRVRRIVAGRERTPVETLRALAGDPDAGTREAVAANVRTPGEVLVALAGDRRYEVRYAAVGNPAAGDAVRETFCSSPYEDARLMLAQQPGLPSAVVARLARDPARAVREFVAEHTDDPDALATLVEDGHPAVRAQAAQNRHTTEEQRRQLARDPAATVRSALLHAMARLGWVIPEDDLLRLARDRSVNVRYWVAGLPGSTRAVYEILAEDPDDQIATNARRWLVPGPERGGFPDPRRLGRPAPHIDAYLWNQFANR
ncbi:hypothetical protein JIG36_04635 [Actinoplanes sp. LDG1-06]|uniref:Leucine rich repeat variant n=1 Tax=Paractinoplanes ovalisporus TaxID=2810368 RepID=A0ABS2A6B5_9ACTN|nr:hypothetical protein [Actinoplanes ovalisporus]MBM2614843.1 hypothetical protein [Actinoplanes ovalisporus]